MSSSGTKAALHSVFATLIAMVGLVAVPLPAAQAAPPSNDDFANAQVLSGPGIVTGTNLEATTEPGEPIRTISDEPGVYAATASVWYRWTSPDVPTQPMILLSTRGSGFDTVLAVYTGGPGLAGLTEVVADDDFGEASGASRVVFQPTRDTTYYVAVDSCCDGTVLSAGDIRLRMSETTGSGTIEGTVTDGANGIEDICVIAVDDTGEQVSTTGYTDASGDYIINSVEAGTDRHVRFSNCLASTPFAGEFNGDAQTLGAAPDIEIGSGQTLTGVDAVLAFGGGISGTISADPGVTGSLEGVCVRATMVGEPDDGFSLTDTTNASGEYTIIGLDGGDYRLRFGGDCGPNYSTFAVEYWDDHPDPADADLITVAEASLVTGRDAGLGAPPGAISGTVREWESGPGIEDICVRAEGPSYTSPSVDTDASGDYTIPDVPAGTNHIVRFSNCHGAPANWTTQWYNRGLASSEATPITVTSGTTTPDIDASMFVAATLGGQVTDSSGGPRDDVCVDVYQSGGSLVRSTTTDASGNWTAPAAPGTYNVFFGACSPGPGYQNLWWHSRTSQGSSEDVFVDQGDAVTNLDQLLPDDGMITGRVLNSNGNPIPDVCVTAYIEDTTTSVAVDETDSFGYYDLGVDAGTYDVQYLDCSLVYQEQWFDDEPDQASADAITVPAETTVRANATLVRWGTISGTVRDGAGDPVSDICVSSYDENENPLPNEVETAADGTYRIGGMATGDYLVEFSDCTGGSTFGTEFYNNKLTLDTANPVHVSMGVDAGGIDAVLPTAAPVNLVLPEITGPARHGVVMVADPGTWQHDPSTYDYQWYSCDAAGASCAPVGTDRASYLVMPSDVGRRIYVSVVATNSIGASTPADSALTDVVQDGPPPNDDFDDRQVLTGGTPIHVLGTNVSATREPGEPPHLGFTQGASVWYEWTAPSGPGALDRMVIDTNGSPFITTVSVYDGTASFSGLHLVAEDNYSDGFTGQVDFAPAPGTTYYIAVDGYWDSTTSTTDTGTIEMTLSAASGISGIVTNSNGDPVRDICVTADSEDASNAVTTRGDGTFFVAVPAGYYTVGYSDCTLEYADQWYDGVDVVEGATPVLVEADTVTSGIDAELVRQTDFGSISGQVTNDDGYPIPNICVFAYGYGGGDFGGFTRTDSDGTYQIRGLGDPSETVQYEVQFQDCSGFYGDEYYDNAITDSAATAVPVEWDQTTTSIDAVLQHDAPVNGFPPLLGGQASVGMTLKASNGVWEHEPSEFSFDWYRCDADGVSNCTVVNSGDRFYDIAAEDEGYTIKVEVTATNSIGSATAESYPTAVVDDAAPYNDDIQDRIVFGPSPSIDWFGSNVRATRQAGEPAHAGFTESKSVWFEWTAPSGGAAMDAVSIDVPGTVTYAPTISVYTGTPVPLTGLTLVAEDASAGMGYDSTQVVFEPVPGTTYYIAVDGYYDGSEISSGPIDLQLAPASGVSGTVTDDEGDPVRDICVAADATDGSGDYYEAYSDADGTYLLAAPAGEYVVSFTDCIGEYADQWYDDASVVEDADPVTVPEDEVVPDIDAQLVRVETLGTISGTVTNEAGDPLPFMCVVAYEDSSGYPSFGETDQNGSYLIRGLGDPDNPTTEFEYIVTFVDCSGFYGSEMYDNALDPEDATLVPASAEDDVTGIDAVLQHEAPVNTGLPTISGSTAPVGSSLTTTNGTWQHQPGLFEYQWLRCNSGGAACTPIVGADEVTYDTTSSDTGARLRVDVIASNSIGSATARSSYTAIVGAPTSTAAPTVSGSATIGGGLTATPGTWTGSPTYVYKWQRCNVAVTSCTFISGAESSTYTVTSDDAGSRLRIHITATNAAGSATAVSNPTIVVGAPTLLTAPTVSGSPTIGGGLTATTGTWTGSPSSYGYKWQRCNVGVTSCTVIAGAESSTYTVTSDDAGFRLRIHITATNAAGSATTVSNPTNVVGAPTLVTAPTVSGSPTVGAGLTANEGTWTGSPDTYAFRWQRCNTAVTSCTNIPGAQSSTYTVTSDDAGFRLRIHITATNAAGSTTAWSNPTAVIGAPAPSSAAADVPVVTGTAAVGSLLTASEGVWSGTVVSYAYRWQRCNAAVTSCTNIPGAEANTYTVTVDDAGFRLRIHITATNLSGSATSWSNPTIVVGAPTLLTSPSVSGSPTLSSTLTALQGDWNGTPSSYTFRWQRCNAAVTSCTNIPGAEANTYAVTAGDTGFRLRIHITATNAAGSATAWSFPTAVVS